VTAYCYTFISQHNSIELTCQLVAMLYLASYQTAACNQTPIFCTYKSMRLNTEKLLQMHTRAVLSQGNRAIQRVFPMLNDSDSYLLQLTKD